MSGLIPQTFVDDLLRRTDIVELIDEHVPLKRQGRDPSACCPFHDEKTPSFTVSGEKQFYYCFGCQASGSALGFLMEFKGLGFVEAVEELAERLNLEIPREGGGARAPSANLGPIYELLEQANRIFQRHLREHPEAKQAVEYLKGRGLSGEIAAQFQIGYSPPGWDALTREIGTADERLDALMEAGLIAERGTGSHRSHYDRFRNRIMFPIRDTRGRVVGFGGRVLDDDGPKYLNSPETPVFHKGQELYGLYQARRANSHPTRLLVVEGYMDVVALAQFGIDYAVATLGTASTREHLERLFRASRDVVFCFDGDGAGRRAAWRALETALPFMRDGRSAYFLFMPEGLDPDDFVRANGADALNQAVQNAQPLSEYLFDHTGADSNLNTVEGRSQLVEKCRPLVERVPNGPFKELLNSRLSELSKISSEKLTMLIGSSGQAQARPRRANSAPESSRGPSLVRRALHLLIHDPTLAARAGSSADLATRIAPLELRGIPLLVAMLDFLEESPDLTTGAVLERFRDDDLGRHLSKLAASPAPILESVSAHGSETLETEFRDILKRFDELTTEHRYDELRQKNGPLTEAEKAELRLLLVER
jgi:DNA primase